MFLLMSVLFTFLRFLVALSLLVLPLGSCRTCKMLVISKQRSSYCTLVNYHYMKRVGLIVQLQSHCEA